MSQVRRKIYLTVGMPASGKSSYISKLVKEQGAKAYSTDALREDLDKEMGTAGRDEDGHQKINIPRDEIYARIRNKIIDDFEQGLEAAVFDATFTDPDLRRSEIDFWRNRGVEVEGVIFGVSLETAKERNLKRERQVKPEVIESMSESLHNNPIDTSIDNFENIYGVDESGNSELLYSRCDKETVVGSEFSILRLR